MTTFKPFKALRPKKEYAADVCCLPYDVLSEEDIKRLAENPLSFVHVIRSEVDVKDCKDVYSKQVYEKAKQNLQKYEDSGVMFSDPKDGYYIYSQISRFGQRRGLCGLISNEEYKNGTIKRHEFTLPQKETDRMNHFLTCNAHTEPVFLLYRDNLSLEKLISGVCESTPAEYDFTDEFEVTHKLWHISDDKTIEAIENLLASQSCLYIADGHHRTASACRAGEALEARNLELLSACRADDAQQATLQQGNNENSVNLCSQKCEAQGSTQEQYKYTMAVIFPESELAIIDYNRLLKDIAPFTQEEFLEKLSEDFTVKKLEKEEKTTKAHDIAMYLGENWYMLSAKPESFNAQDPVLCLDASILQNNVFSKLLSIDDPRTSDRLSFVGGIKGYEALKNAVDSKEYAAAFALFPVSCKMLMDVADSGMVMPPKSTWFEPKLSSGLFVHKF